MNNGKTIDELQVGDTASMTFTITEDRVDAFAKATGDYNPLHVDSEYAEQSQFGRRIAHGVLLTGIVSGLLGTKLPGLGTVAREMTSKFSLPVFIGDTVTAFAELVEKKEKLNMCIFKFYVKNQFEKIVGKGTAVVLPRKQGIT